jgi:hypothetical protein
MSDAYSNEKNIKDNSNIIKEEIIKEEAQEVKENIVPIKNEYAGEIKNGVEVISVKPTLKDKEKIGLPITDKEKKNFDRF